MINKSAAKTQAGAIIDEGLRQYLMRVYNFMAGGLVVTALVAYLIANTSLFNLFFSTNAQGYAILSGFGYLMIFAPLIMVFAFSWVIYKGTAAQAQAAFWAFSALMGAALTPILMAYTNESITKVFLITAAMFGAMSIYGYTTKKDLTTMGSYLIMGLWGLIIASVVNIFFKSSGMSYALSFVAVIVFTGLTAYDTQKIRQIYNSEDVAELSTKKAVSGALSLYMDFINIFIALLNLFGNRR